MSGTAPERVAPTDPQECIIFLWGILDGCAAAVDRGVEPWQRRRLGDLLLDARADAPAIFDLVLAAWREKHPERRLI